MKVRAKGSPDQCVGYYGYYRRRGGDVFTLTDPKHFSEKWMEKAGETTPDTKPTVKKQFSQNRPVEESPPSPPEPDAGEAAPEATDKETVI